MSFVKDVVPGMRLVWDRTNNPPDEDLARQSHSVRQTPEPPRRTPSSRGNHLDQKPPPTQ